MPGRPAVALRLAVVLLAGVAVLALAGEIGLRVLAGERLLYRADPEIEYLPAPDQAVVQRGVAMRTNAWGMRSEPVDAQQAEDAFRILVVGDSVVFGFLNINHADLATSLLSGRRTTDGRRIEALNVSASSWGPGNMLAWLDRFGTLEADAIVLVLSTHDLGDDRTFRPPERDVFPLGAPTFALADWIWRKLTPDPAQTIADDPRTPGDAQRALPGLMGRVASAPAGGCLIVHATTDELREPVPTPYELTLNAMADAAGVDVLFGRDFVDANEGFVDDIHLSASGQADLVRAITACPALPAIAD